MNGADEADENGPGRAAEWGWSLFESPVGPLLLAATADGLVQVVFHATPGVTRRALDRLHARTGREPHGGRGAPGTGPWAGHLACAERELAAYFAGDLRVFTVPLDWSLTGGFHLRVLRALAAGVPYGTTAGYQDLADRVGEPGAARAVGVAMGANPLPVVVPCHRVVESGGGLGGFGGGRETKRELLALEGLLPQPLF
ncbi:methylated-DNA--[protein]-cysteine S-methyltransferase [Streptomyces sp. DSM 42041]|uniref:Methylated-DNA--protein-cysteine methyltransferase n=1 Tax=Streptomyces hazeniae TaxID=3075538 RepID=A0ABU2NSF1_9ACTN|nr:methylated-DNA--[protein]-cysteine S-methyltransferase [Streptomyces sp. DSM 42041]MDT0379910.1 methylated-DNA--[protein]-cysteine S-methyltransferase [Streptomyces sp. DSM 42041]